MMSNAYHVFGPWGPHKSIGACDLHCAELVTSAEFKFARMASFQKFVQKAKYQNFLELLTGRIYAKVEKSIYLITVKPLITDPPKSGQPLYNGRLTCPRLILP